MNYVPCDSESIIDSKFFTVLADETSNILVVEQLALCVRYVDKNKNVNEVFFKFFPVQILTGKHLADSILNGLMSCGVDCNYLCGQGCDGASNMASHVRPCLCQPHSLNLVVSTASNIKPIRNCLGIIENFENSKTSLCHKMEAVDKIKDIVSELKFLRSECENELRKRFVQAKKMAVKMDIELSVK
ncbi:hypothetical protein AGLY_013287 [Aphis glycines]|uniref:DUF4371 domain-containing protein n=1 Tax=Aphis glycines TaxID=307491 RepID=A0A6G0T802_APHGL|nr:hypothetical protein AGLY_013287 [Aphis glycines]